MGMVMFLIFLMTDLIMVGIFAVVYGKKDRYSEGMMLGVRIPPWAKEDPVRREKIQSLIGGICRSGF